jgi:hypothetical protein
MNNTFESKFTDIPNISKEDLDFAYNEKARLKSYGVN